MGRRPDRKRDKKPEKSLDNTQEPQKKTGQGNRILVFIILIAAAAIAGAFLFGSQILSPAQPATSDRTIFYFYGEECPHCHNVTPYVSSLRGKYPGADIRILEVWHNTTNNNLYTLLNHRLGKEPPGVPEIIIGNFTMLGEQEIREGLEPAIARLQNVTGSSTVGGTPEAGDSSSNQTIDAIYFYGNGCSHCESVKPLIAEIQRKYPELRLEMLEINDNKTNLQTFIAMGREYGLASISTPTVFIGGEALVGETAVRDHFEEKIVAEELRTGTGSPANTSAGNSSAPAPAPVLSPFMVVAAALVDSANPCGLAVLVFLLISMAAAGGRKRILLVGGVYVAAMFLFHLFVGIGLFSALAISGLARPFSLIGGVIALVLGLITLLDVLRNRQSYLLSIPESGKGLIGSYARKATLPAAFVLGILAGILGFSCTGGIYLSILGLMGRAMTVMEGLPWLILYNFVYVLPLVLVTLLVAWGLSPDRADRWRSTHKRTIRVIIGLILLGLGIVILAGWIG